MIKYKNLVDMIEIEEDSNQFDIRQEKSKEIFDEFIKILSSKTNIKSLKFTSNSKKISNSSFEFDFNNKKYSLNMNYIKNSGTKNNNNKRFQIKNNLYLKNAINSYFAFLNIGKENLFFITKDITKFIENYIQKEVSKSYSSFWISYNDIRNFLNNKDDNLFIDKKGTLFSKDLNLLIDAFLNDYNNKNSESPAKLKTSFDEIDDEDIFDFVIDNFVENEVEDFDHNNIKNIDNNNKLKRDSRIISDFLKQNQFCKACDSTTTFRKRNEDIQYFEVHHFIPYNMKTQKNFKKTLDSKLNLVTLCANCHRKIHLSCKDEQIIVINKIADKIIGGTFIETYPEYNLDTLIKWYEDLYKKG
ncbi:HNH endonuclease signature motif containing protein [Spiroplasma endosymbiont of Dioctria linearis]|uniref:HNH endonuclease signature motif containing protein n=1 Tax=Spiroplasma endosymbiont of Dioctria linearis TaxID=3066290 RepID=UPI00313E963C